MGVQLWSKPAARRLLATLAVAGSVVAFVSGCSQGDDEQRSDVSAPDQPSSGADRPLRVINTFNIGPNTFARALKIEPDSNSLWVGTSAGVLEIDLQNQTVRQTFTREDGLANEYVFAIGIDQVGTKWFGTNAGGMSSYKDGEWKTYFPMHGLADYWVYAFANQGDDTLWVGTWAGVNRLNIRTGKMDTFVEELINEWVYGLGVDSEQRVWFGTEGGVSMFDGTKWQSWTHEDGLGAPNDEILPPSKNTGLGTRERHDLGVLRGGQATYNPNYVFGIHVTEDDQVWAGTWGGGVSRFDGKTWQNLTQEDGLAGDIVYAVTQDAEGTFWFGTSGGVSRYDGTNWQTFDQADGLVGNHVYALAVDPATGDIWAGSRGGVTRIGRAGN